MPRHLGLLGVTFLGVACVGAIGQQQAWPQYRIERLTIANFTPVALNNAGQACGYQWYSWCCGQANTRSVIRDLDGTVRVNPERADDMPLNIDDEGVLYGVGAGSGCRDPSCWLPKWDAVKFDPLLRPVMVRAGYGGNGNSGSQVYQQYVMEQSGYGIGNLTDGWGGQVGWLRRPNGSFVSLPDVAIDFNRRMHILLRSGSLATTSLTNTAALPMPGTCESRARDLNNVDGRLLWGGCNSFAFRRAGIAFPDSSIVSIPELPGAGEVVEALRMNDSFVVVGSDQEELCSGCQQNARRALAFHPTLGSVSLNSRIANPIAGVSIVEGKDINNWGMILATTSDGAGCVLVPDVACATVLVQPEGRCVTSGSVAWLSAAFVSPVPLTFQWYKDGLPLVDGPDVFGATLPSLIIDSMSVAHVGAYSCVATAACGSIATVAASLRLPATLSITQQPQSQAVASTGSVTFSVGVDRSSGCASPLQFVWQRRDLRVADENAPGAWIDLNDGGVVVNARTQAMTLLQALPGTVGPYRCRIADPCGCDPIFSEPADFSVACPADFNADGGVDFTDVEAFFERWENGC